MGFARFRGPSLLSYFNQPVFLNIVLAVLLYIIGKFIGFGHWVVVGLPIVVSVN